MVEEDKSGAGQDRNEAEIRRGRNLSKFQRKPSIGGGIRNALLGLRRAGPSISRVSSFADPLTAFLTGAAGATQTPAEQRTAAGR